jgi:hypothetical protein
MDFITELLANLSFRPLCVLKLIRGKKCVFETYNFQNSTPIHLKNLYENSNKMKVSQKCKECLKIYWLVYEIK